MSLHRCGHSRTSRRDQGAALGALSPSTLAHVQRTSCSVCLQIRVQLWSLHAPNLRSDLLFLL